MIHILDVYVPITMNFINSSLFIVLLINNKLNDKLNCKLNYKLNGKLNDNL
jgi:hypothetical protein